MSGSIPKEETILINTKQIESIKKEENSIQVTMFSGDIYYCFDRYKENKWLFNKYKDTK